MEDYDTSLTIKAWAEADRPREKLLTKGTAALSDAELVAILIGSGTRKESAVQLSKRILGSVDNSLNELGRLSVKDLMKFKGIGEAKAISIVAALEMGRRRKNDDPQKKPTISSSSDAYNILNDRLEDLSHEEFWILLLNRANRVIGSSLISRGGVNGTVADTRIIFKHAIESLASFVILCHNHPSGNLKPSQLDIDLTKRLKEAGQTMEIPVLDHLIIGNGDYYSFADEGLL